MLRQLLLILVSLLAATAATAQDLTPFEARYSASYRGLRANAERSLVRLEDGQYQFTSSVSLRLLGRTLTSIDEQSRFLWLGEALLPQSYAFVQSGLGSRSRSVQFDWEHQVAEVLVEDDPLSLPLDGPVFDELNVYIELKRQLEQGAGDVTVMTLDKDRIEEERYRVIGEETVETELGNVAALKLEKVREPDSPRVTLIWVAPAWDFLLVKLFQRDTDGREMELSLTEATLDGAPLSIATR